jgi:hypothetical protein
MQYFCPQDSKHKTWIKYTISYCCIGITVFQSYSKILQCIIYRTAVSGATPILSSTPAGASIKGVAVLKAKLSRRSVPLR